MGMIKSVFHWVGAKIRQFRDLTSGEDLHEAQMNRSDDHEFKADGSIVSGGPGI